MAGIRGTDRAVLAESGSIGSRCTLPVDHVFSRPEVDGIRPSSPSATRWRILFQGTRPTTAFSARGCVCKHTTRRGEWLALGVGLGYRKPDLDELTDHGDLRSLV